MSVTQKTRKPLLGKGFIYLFLFLFIVDYRPLLADTKLRKDGSEDLFNADLTGNSR